MRFISVVAFAMALGSCEEVAEDTVGPSVEEPEDGSVSFFHLKCTGTETIDNWSVEEKTVILAVPEQGTVGKTVYEFREDDQLYYGFCSTKMYECPLEINSDSIAGFGSTTSDDYTISSSLFINRITGRVTNEFNNGGLKTVFEGQCEPTDPPEVATPKF